MDVLKKLADRLFEKRPDEDIVDRANNSATPFLLLCCAIVVFAKEYGPVSEPMYCWTQAEFNEQWMEYIHEYCFVESTYYVPFNESVSATGQRNNGNDRLNYYQWVPFILVAMALFSQSTHYFWSFCNMLSEKDLPNILRKISAVVYEGEDQTTDITEGIASHLHVILLACSCHSSNMTTMDCKKQRRKSKICRGIFARNCLAFVYLFTKLLYFIFNIVQFKFISVFLGVNNLPSWGWTVLNSFMVHGTSWEHSGHFPRVTLCDLKIRQPDERFHDFTVQCVLVANFLNEKIFLMLYFWFILMAIVSLGSFVQWCWTLLYSSQSHYVNRLIELSLLQLHPDPEFDFGRMIRESAGNRQRDESATEGAETEDGDETECHQHVHFNAAVSEIAATKTENLCEDNRSDGPSNNSTATMEEMAQHTMKMQKEKGTTDASASADGADPLVAALHHHHQLHQCTGNTSIRNLATKWDDEDEEALFIDVQRKRNELYREFKMNKSKFMTFLGIDGIMAAKMMCSSAGLQMTSLVMGRLLYAFLQQHDKSSKDQTMLPV